ncbi:BnaC05g37090D [Brassica napus]|uniref:BnaC05g37090D protein n=1 Tax=Brassica napus TaxID=3708 RepID=A0A078GZZ3_BRANA|nr:BnaC05g37090D [Brassica napus]
MMHKMATSHNIQDLLGFWREALGSTSMKVNWLPRWLT